MIRKLLLFFAPMLLLPPASLAHQVTLNWTAPSQGCNSGCTYNVYRAGCKTCNKKQITTTDPTTTYIDTTVVSGHTYWYWATTVNSAGQESVYSTPVKAVIPNP